VAEHPMEKLARELCGEEVCLLSLAKGLKMKLGRIGYAEEGLRLTIYMGMPFEFNAELKLSRRDALWLHAQLDKALADPSNSNMPE
jgi:hypothetical protein